MRIVTTINPQLTDPDQVADVARYFLRGVILANRLLIRAGLVPALYNSGVRYRPEPWPSTCRRCKASNAPQASRCASCGGRELDHVEEFADAATVLHRGWGDCDDLSPWRTAELQEAGDLKADSKISWKTACKNCGAKVNGNSLKCPRCGSTRRNRVFHVVTRRGDGRVEDPSQYLGM
jgi:RNA polymerase subunit RPABC4/transcription elongation factor Spt4